jgi:hypothetical protein
MTALVCVNFEIFQSDWMIYLIFKAFNPVIFIIHVVILINRLKINLHLYSVSAVNSTRVATIRI